MPWEFYPFWHLQSATKGLELRAFLDRAFSDLTETAGDNR